MPRLSFGVVVFPGSNCDHDAYYVLKEILHQDVRFLWHKNPSIEHVDVVILPGGFSYGDYLRCGAIARFSPVMKEIISFANSGGVVVGICNGFQILCETGLLPGALLRNEGLTFVCKFVNLRVENADTIFTSACRKGDILRIPVAHGEGKYYADDATIERLESGNRILFRYCEPDGSVTAAASPNGALNNIAGIVNDRGNVMGMMPHPERASDSQFGETDGQMIFRSVIEGMLQRQQLHDHVTIERR